MNPKTAAQLRAAGIRPESLPAGAKINGKAIEAAEAEKDKRYQPKRGEMNKTERRYADQLDAWKAIGTVVAWWFDPFSFRLAARTYYRPDFLVQWATGVLQIVDVKGYWEEDAKVKYKLAREMFSCFQWAAVRRVKGGWEPAI